MATVKGLPTSIPIQKQSKPPKYLDPQVVHIYGSELQVYAGPVLLITNPSMLSDNGFNKCSSYKKALYNLR